MVKAEIWNYENMKLSIEETVIREPKRNTTI